MIELLAVFMLTCPEPKIINWSDEPVNEKLIEQAKRTCMESYNKKCLKVLIKKKDKHHYGICGEGE